MMVGTPAPSARTQAREAFFLTFANAVRSRFPDVPLMVTGGFRTRGGMAAAIRAGDCDLIGLGRPTVLDPRLPRNIIFNPDKGDSDRLYTVRWDNTWSSWMGRLMGSRSVGAGLETVSIYTPFLFFSLRPVTFSKKETAADLFAPPGLV